MKNTNAININKNKKFNRKLYILLAGMFATSVSATSMDTIEVIEIETTNHYVIMNQAKADLATSLKASSLNTTSAQTSAAQQLAAEAESYNQHMTLAKVTLVAE